MRKYLQYLLALFVVFFPAIAADIDVAGALRLSAVLLVPPPPVDPPDPPPADTNAPLALSYAIFPLEVLGPPDTTAEISLYVTNGALADKVYFQVHGLTYAGKMSVRVNSGLWVTATDSTVTYPYRLERANYGMGTIGPGTVGAIAGSLATLRFTLPASNWTFADGTNTFEFRFNDLDGFSIGYRVLNLNVEHLGTNLIAANQIVQDDPSAWTAPSGGDATLGETAWRTATISERGSTLNVHCTDCHAEDAMDLKYFNYSNLSIIQRSRFHGLSAETGTNIAAFVRGLPYTFEPNGRPWNPPYQPGPGMDTNSVYSWAAGAGLSSVLEEDTDTFTYLFPGGITTNNSNLNFTNNLSFRIIPLAMQFPDWNHWLPQIHPSDAYTNSPNMATNAFVLFYPTLRSNLLTKATQEEQAIYMKGQVSPWDVTTATTGIVKPSTSDPNYIYWVQKEKGFRHWRVTKVWELMNQLAIQDYGLSVFPTYTNGAVTFPPNERTWFAGEIFILSPHKLAATRYDTFSIESMMWYQLQLVLNDSNRHNPGIVPIDWGYQHALCISAWPNPEQFPFYAVETVNIMGALKSVVQGLPVSDGSSLRFGKEQLKWVQNPPELGASYAVIPNSYKTNVSNAVVLADIKLMEWFPKSDYLSAGLLTGKSGTFWSNNLVYYGPRMTSMGVDPAIVARWDALKTYLFP